MPASLILQGLTCQIMFFQLAVFAKYLLTSMIVLLDKIKDFTLPSDTNYTIFTEETQHSLQQLSKTWRGPGKNLMRLDYWHRLHSDALTELCYR